MIEPPRTLRERYRLDEALTRRGASTTWLARDLATGASCVVKELSVGAVVREGSSELSYDGNFTKVIDLFEREARVLAHLDHPGIPEFIDHFQEEVGGDSRLFTVQEFVDGETLEEVVQGGRHVTEAEAVEICRAVTEILGFLHDRSPPLIHRDVKPSNIILGEDGAVHLVDFGSVRDLLEPHPLDGKTIVGTYGYMPMEQYEGRAVPQSDFYALGMTLVYLLSHREPTELPRAGMRLDFRDYVNASERFCSLVGWLIEPPVEARPPNARAILDLLDPRRGNLPDLPGTPGPPSAARVHPVVSTRVKAGVALVAGLIGFLIAVLGLFGAGVPLTEEGQGGVGALPPSERGLIGPAPSTAERVEGVLSIDLDRDFDYVPRGFPMGRAAHQTVLPDLEASPPPGVTRIRDRDPVLYGRVRLGNASDPRVHFALVDRGAASLVYFDANHNGDLLDDGSPHTDDGSGTAGGIAVRVSTDVEIRDRGDVHVRPYQLWLWFSPNSGRMEARMYALHHYAGTLRIGDRDYPATVFEQSDHDALYHDAGICIDLSGDGRCDEDAELFRHGDVVMTPSGRYRVELDYP